MKRNYLAQIMILVLSSAFSGCNLPQRIDRTQASNAVHTAAAQTVAVELTQMASDLTPFPLFFTEMPSATGQPPGTLTPGPGAAVTMSTIQPCDRVTFLTDVTYPDGSTVPAGSTFIKTWRLKNSGACVWTSAYTLVFIEGDSFGVSASVPITSGIVAPGETVDISITLTAPTEIKTYQGFFKLRNTEGVNFGIGAGGSASFWVKISTIPPVTTTP